MKKVSVIIPAHNEEKTINFCLDSVLRQENFEKYIGEIIAVDDFSTDATPKILEEYKNKIKTIRNKKNLGLAKTMNAGISQAKGDFICSLHADCVLPENWMEESMKLFDGRTAVVNSRIILPKNIWLGFGFWNRIFFSKFLKPRKLICEGKCDIWRKDILNKIGLFSGDFRVAGEDFDLFCRLRENGYKLRSSNLLVKHIMSSHQLGFWKYFRKELQYGEARGAILRKHHFFIMFNPLAFKTWLDARLIIALPLVIFLRTVVHFIGFWKGLLSGKQEW